MGSTVSNLIFVLSCCRTQRRFSMNPSVDTNRSSACDRSHKAIETTVRHTSHKFGATSYESTFTCNQILKPVTVHVASTVNQLAGASPASFQPSIITDSLTSATAPEPIQYNPHFKGLETKRQSVRAQSLWLLYCPTR